MLLQVKQAIPRVEERTYRRGQVLVEQGKVPEGLFLILSGVASAQADCYLCWVTLCCAHRPALLDMHKPEMH